MSELHQPFADLLPPLTPEEFEALRASIELDGVRDAIVVDEAGNILDGHHRHSIAPDAPTRVMAGLTEGQKRAFVMAANFQRRNLSPNQKSELRERQIEIARIMKEEGSTQKDIAARLGIAQNTVSDWFNTTNIGTDISNNPSPPDNRRKLTDDEKEQIIKDSTDGTPQKQIAENYGVSQSAVSKIVGKKNGNKIPVPDGETLESLCRPHVDAGTSVAVAAQEVGIAQHSFACVRDVLRLLDMNLSEKDSVLVREVMDEMNKCQQVAVQHDRLGELINRVWGSDKHHKGAEKRRIEDFRRATGVIIQAASGLSQVEIPYFNDTETVAIDDELKTAEGQLRGFRNALKKGLKET